MSASLIGIGHVHPGLLVLGIERFLCFQCSRLLVGMGGDLTQVLRRPVELATRLVRLTRCPLCLR
jgi:hypothetical protein